MLTTPPETVTKVTFCVYDKPDSVGGPVTWIQRLVPALRDRGVEPRCLFLLHWGETGPALDSLRAEGIDCKWITAPVRTEERVRWILDHLIEDPPDVFVPNLVVAGYYAGRWAREAGIPTVGVLHSDDDYYRAIQDEFIFGNPKYRVSSVVCVSKELERQVVSREPVGVRVERIPYGVPFPAGRVGPPENIMRIVYVGRLAQEQKRILDVTRVLCGVVRDVPGTEAVIYGDGPEKDKVLEILATDGADLPVHFAGGVPSESILSELLSAHVILLLSDYEGLPIALLEAMACGCVPVCLKMRSGISELIEDRVSGILVDKDDEVSGAIEQLRANQEQWRAISEQARMKASEFSTDRCADAWTSILNETRANNAPGPIRSPSRLRLPRANLALESPEQREKLPGLVRQAYGAARILAGRLRRIVFKSAASR
jgi:colanic acid/amylovoran biosynthesis glycosyltransferase